jgi:hypothetical protein
MPPVAGSTPALCFNHAPERARDRAEARKRGGEAKRTPHLFPIGEVPVGLRDVASIQNLLEMTVHETRVQPNGHDRSRALGSLLMIALKVLEVGALEDRIAALEQQVSATRPRRMA